MISPAVVPENPPSTASGLGLLRVLDATDGVAGQFCGRLFADNGADVILLETLEGTRTRGEDGLSWHLNCGKRTVAGDPVTFGGDDLDALLRGLDVVIVDQNTAPFGWDLATHPRLVVCCMSDFGAVGPCASWQGPELVHQAYSGLAYSTGRVDAEPLYGFGHRAYYCAGLAAYGATLAALVERECSGTGQKVRVSVAETAAAMSQNLVTIYPYSQTVPRRGAYEGPLDCYWCADGWIVVFVSTGRWPAVCEAFGLTKSQAAVRELVSGSEVLICPDSGSPRHRLPGARRPAARNQVEKAQKGATAMNATTDTLTSADGTTIAVECAGEGPPVILVGGAFNDRSTVAELAGVLADGFTAVSYDRRGRGGSGDAASYAAEREIDDLAAVISHVGAPAGVFGHSSGAVLALEAAAAGLDISKVAAYEPTYVVEGTRPRPGDDLADRLQALLDGGDRDGAVALFQVEVVGLPAEMISGMRGSPMWGWFTGLAHTLPYDVALTGPGMRLPASRFAGITVPVLAIGGGASPPWLPAAARAVAEAVPGGRYVTLDGQDHGVLQQPGALRDLLTSYFGAG